MYKTFFSTSETARLLNINRVTVYRWIKEKKLEAHKMGMRFRIPSSEVARLLRSVGLSGPFSGETLCPGMGGKDALRDPQGMDTGGRRKLVLVIDRDRDVHGFIEACLAELGFNGTCRLRAFSSGIEAAVRIGLEDPDVVLLDAQMPDMDGLELARKIREVHGQAGIVLMTRTRPEPGRDDPFETLVKPLNLTKLDRAIGAYLR